MAHPEHYGKVRLLKIGDINGVILNVYSKDTRKKLKNLSEYTKKLRVYKTVLGLQYHNR